MASVIKKTLISETTLTASKTGDAVSMEPHQKNFIAFAKISNRTAGTYDTVIQHSPNGVDWFDNGTFASASGNGSEIIALTNGNLLLPYIRAVVTVTSGPGDADIEIILYYDKEK